MDILAPLAILLLSVLSQLSRSVKLQIEVRKLVGLLYCGVNLALVLRLIISHSVKVLVCVAVVE